jgi:pimeloyl-ACP methyl ester carboxylesterase
MAAQGGKVKVAGAALVAFVAILLIASALLFRPDLPRATLISRYTDARSRFIDLPDGSMAHVRLEGPMDRPAVVLLHGAMASLQSFDSWAPDLSRNFRVIGIDEPGSGLTGPTVSGDYSRAGMVAFVHAVLGRLGVRQAALVGHSMGGGVAAEYAERHPNEVWALVLVDASGIPRRVGEGSVLGSMAHHALLRPLLRWTLPRWLIARGIRSTFADSSKVGDDMIDRINDLTHYPGNRAALMRHYLAPNDDTELQARLSGLAMPTLVLWGDADPILSVSSAREFARRIPNARLIIYPGVGHVVPEEFPQQSSRDVAAFLTGVTNPR